MITMNKKRGAGSPHDEPLQERRAEDSRGQLERNLSADGRDSRVNARSF